MMMLAPALLALLASPATADGQPASSWTCNAAAGDFSRNGLEVASGYAVSGTIEFLERHGGTRWASGANVNFRRARGEQAYGGLAIYQAEAGDRNLTIGLTGFGGTMRPVGQIAPSGPVAFTVRIEPSGTVTAAVADHTFSMPGRAFAGGVAQVSCSSARVAFGGLSTSIIEY